MLREEVPGLFHRIDGTDEFTHTVSGYDVQGKVDGRGPVVFRAGGGTAGKLSWVRAICMGVLDRVVRRRVPSSARQG